MGPAHSCHSAGRSRRRHANGMRSCSSEDALGRGCRSCWHRPRIRCVCSSRDRARRDSKASSGPIRATSPAARSPESPDRRRTPCSRARRLGIAAGLDQRDANRTSIALGGFNTGVLSPCTQRLDRACSATAFPSSIRNVMPATPVVALARKALGVWYHATPWKYGKKCGLANSQAVNHAAIASPSRLTRGPSAVKT